jgi:hypothetical protein
LSQRKSEVESNNHKYLEKKRSLSNQVVGRTVFRIISDPMGFNQVTIIQSPTLEQYGSLQLVKLLESHAEEGSHFIS